VQPPERIATGVARLTAAVAATATP
jgi:hypothetical protein